MKDLFIFLIVVGILSPLRSQETKIFTFPELDGKLTALWTSAETGLIGDIQTAYAAVELSWQLTVDDLQKNRLRHLDIPIFIAEQGVLLESMEHAIDQRDFSNIAQQCYAILHNFQEVRIYFTSDLYSLDELISAFTIYDRLHYAVDDPMLGLYDWHDFVQLFADFKKQFNRFVIIAKPGFNNSGSVLFELAVQRVHECSKEFEIALEGAQQSDFVAPCDDTRDALMDLIALYADLPSTSQ